MIGSDFLEEWEINLIVDNGDSWVVNICSPPNLITEIDFRENSKECYKFIEVLKMHGAKLNDETN